MRSGESDLKLVAAVCAVLAVLAVGEAARASNLSFLKDAPTSKFNEEDVQLMTNNAQAVLAETKTPLLREWSNPKTKHSGSAESLVAFAGPNGITCKRLRIANHADGLDGKATYTLCNMGAEGWRLVPSDFAPLPNKKPPASEPKQ